MRTPMKAITMHRISFADLVSEAIRFAKPDVKKTVMRVTDRYT